MINQLNFDELFLFFNQIIDKNDTNLQIIDQNQPDHTIEHTISCQLMLFIISL